MNRMKITEEIRETARKLLATAKSIPTREPWGTKFKWADHKRLVAIADGTRKQIDERWWLEINGVAAKDKLDKLARLADPERNDNPHERDLARVKLAELKRRRPPGASPESPPLPSTLAEWDELKKQATQMRKQQRAAGRSMKSTAVKEQLGKTKPPEEEAL